MGSFYKDGIDKKEFATMNEDEPVWEMEVTPVPKMETPDSTEPVMTDKIIDKMKVKDLRDKH